MKSLDTIGCGPGTWTARPCAAGVRMSFSIASAASSFRMNSCSASASSGQRHGLVEGALEDREEVRVHPTGAVDVRVSRKDEVHASVPVGLKQLPFDVQANPSLHRVRFLRMVLRHGPGSWTAVHVHVAGKDQGGARGFRGRKSVFRKERDEPWPLGVRDRRCMDDDIHAVDRLDDGFA